MMSEFEGFALSPQQRHLSLRMGDAGRWFRAEAVLRLEGTFREEDLRAALGELVAWHEILRTRFECLEGMSLPLQVVGDSGPAWGERDLATTSTASERAEELRRAFDDLAQSAVDDPERPLRALLLRREGEAPCLCLSLPALCADDATLHLLVGELAAAYGVVCGEEAPEEEPLQFADLAAWLNELLESEETEADRQAWQGEDLLPLLHDRLPFERNGSAVDDGKDNAKAGFRPSEVPLRLGIDPADAATACGVEPSDFLLACWQLLLWRHLDRPELVVSVLFSGREFEELEEALGPVARALPLRVRPRRGDRFRQLARRTGRDLRQAESAGGAFSWDLLLAEGTADAGVGPAFTFEFHGEGAEPTSAQAGGLRFILEEERVCGDRFTLKLSARDRPDGLRASLHYDASRFAAADVEALARRFEALVGRVAADVEGVLGAFDLLPDDERRHLLVEQNDTTVDLGAERRIHHLVHAQAARTPGETAVVYGDERLTYAELESRAAAFAHHLRSLGVRPEERVAIFAERSPQMVVGLLGILAAGGTYVPLDPDHPRERLAAILEDTAPKFVVAQGRLTALLPEVDGTVVDLASVPSTGEAFPAVSVEATNLAYVIHTSGSTGRPKGVMVSHQAITNRLLWMQREFPLKASDRVLQKTPYSFDASIWEIFCPLLAGAELVLARPGGHTDSAYLVEEVAASNITVLQLVPSLLHPFLDEPGASACTSLRRVFCGGEELLAALAKRFAADLPNARLHNLYGPTETAIDATFQVCGEGVGPGSTGAGVPIGRPVDNVRVYHLNPYLQPVPAQVPGEFFIGGDGLARGYQARPGETAARFLPDPHSTVPGGRMYRTGDLVRRLGGGTFEYLGRIDRQVKIRGARIELREIEAVLAEHGGVGQAVVVALPEEAFGEGARLAAYLVPAGDVEGDLDLAGLRLHASERLPSYMLPGAMVVLRSLPRLPNGKVDVASLPAPESGARDGERILARTPTEQLLAGAWAEILDMEPPGIDDNFFDLGGHSLRATQLVTRLRQLFDIELGVRELFQRPTIGQLAEHIDGARLAGKGVQTPPLVPVPRDEALPLSFAQQRLWFLEQLRSTGGLFNIPDVVRFRGSLCVPALHGAIDALVRRHESLRTSFQTHRGKGVQVIGAPTSYRLPQIDLSALGSELAEAEATRQITQLSRLPFDLTLAPLFRVVLLRRAEDEHLLSLTIHHIISDAWSMGVILRELATFYQAGYSGEPMTLPAPPVQYADFARWQREWLVGEVLEGELDYWRRNLRGAPPELNLPTDRPRPDLPSWRGGTKEVRLSGELSESLGELSRREGVTLFMTLLSVFNVLLRGLSGREDVVVGTDVANRNRAETEGVVGFFINQLVLRTDLSGDPTFTELLARVRDVALGAYAHQDVPFDLVVDALKVDRGLRVSPLFQAKFFLENTPQDRFELPELSIESCEVEIEMARLDLILAFWETPEGLVGWVNYNTDLFDPPRIERMMRQYQALAAAVAARPTVRLGELKEVLDQIEKEERTMEKKALNKLGFKSFKAVKPKAVALPTEDVVERTYLEPGQKLPLVIQARAEDVDLADWAKAHAQTLEKDLQEHGAILFRGFGIDTPEVLETFASVLCPGLFNENSEHPRESVSGNIYTPVFYPPDQQLLWHNENSFNHSWPRKIFFACATPAAEGGETPLVDSRRIYQELDPEIRRRFEDKGVIYQRNYAAGLGLPWQTVFRTDSKEEAEERCAAARVDFDWREGDRLRTLAHRPAVVNHPETGETTWFNQAQHWHVSCLDEETKTSMRKLYEDDDLPRQCRYGDGTPIADEDMDAILDLYEELEVAFPWQRGDVLMVDNVLAAHGRNPFKGERKILVALGQMTTFEETGEES